VPAELTSLNSAESGRRPDSMQLFECKRRGKRCGKEGRVIGGFFSDSLEKIIKSAQVGEKWLTPQTHPFFIGRYYKHPLRQE
jgi:hypothetical protein